MIFTLLLCSLDRQELTIKCIDSLLNQSFCDYEILVVDQSEKPYEFPTNMASKIKYFHTEEKGLSHARNVGVSKASGEYICLIDDDAVYHPDYLKNAYLHLLESDYAIVGGKMIDPINGKSKTNKDKSIIKIKWKNALKILASPSMIIRKDILSLHNFDERFGVGARYGCGEESDIVLCCLSKHKKVYYFGDFVVYHPVGTKGSIDRIYSYSIGHGALYYKTKKQYSAFWGRLYYAKTIIGNSLKCFIFLCLNKKNALNQSKARIKGISKGYKDAKKDEF